ncbi:hypothetical protein [Azospirillum doebereinerae]|uniref:hypothetical protein n=1 Tax=Azospirillum doebereinerae TaxID=92933 RepID=UPI00163C6C81|nr:hypothetical protein [Azospirillum doebereinerae]MCG5240894.1 hypothetical protein [Azospirillum doebereinerae]
MADDTTTPKDGNTLTSKPDRAIADPLEAARAVSDTGKPITPDMESAKRPDTPSKKKRS